jgi:hypothetical protein
MASEEVFRKSPEGQAALDARDKRISARLRALMLMSEGKPMSQFATTAAALGAPPDALEQLVRLGFVRTASSPAPAPPPPLEDAYTRFRTVSGLFREIAADVLGLKAFFFILKVEKASTLEDLRELLPVLLPAVAKARGADKAASVEAQLRAMLQLGDS